MQNKNVLLIGGAGYIGLHVAILLFSKGYKISIVDNFSNSKKKYIKIINKSLGIKLNVHNFNAINRQKLKSVIINNKINFIMHFAGFKSAEESMLNPDKYYLNNIKSTINILRVMEETKCKNILFSSSACIYGKPNKNPINENEELKFENVYGHTKLVSEELIKSAINPKKKYNYAILRYFNPIGAHSSGLIGDDQKKNFNNLIPNIIKSLKGNCKIKIFGKNFNSHDGTCVRDYVHVEDIAYGHYLSLKKIRSDNESFTINLGTGIGYSVLDVIDTFNKVNETKIKYEFKSARKGDVDIYYASPKKANKYLKWKAKKNLAEMCKSSFNFLSRKKDL